jgi:hypothetical protein
LNSNANSQSDVLPQDFYREICRATLAASRAPGRAASRRIFHAEVMTTTDKDFARCLLYVFKRRSYLARGALILATLARCFRRSLSAAVAYGTAPRSWSSALGSLPFAGSRAKAAARDLSLSKAPFLRRRKTRKIGTTVRKLCRCRSLSTWENEPARCFPRWVWGDCYDTSGSGPFSFRPGWRCGNSRPVRHSRPVGRFGGEKAV